MRSTFVLLPVQSAVSKLHSCCLLIMLQGIHAWQPCRGSRSPAGHTLHQIFAPAVRNECPFGKGLEPRTDWQVAVQKASGCSAT
eukprot:350077-Chlamydomonas_euryale.AAC.8